MESIVRFIKDLDWANNIFFLLLGALLTKLCSWIFAQVNYIKRKQKMKKTTNFFLTEGINSLDHAEKFYAEDDISAELLGEERFYLSIPQNYLADLRKHSASYQSREECYFAKNTLAQLGEEMGIDGFDALVERHRTKVAAAFLDSYQTGKGIFNGEKVGIRRIISTRSSIGEKNEANELHFQMYKTDYFTHRVMRSVYQEIRENNKDLAAAATGSITDINRYYPFMTSLGINSVVVLHTNDQIEQIVLAERAAFTSNTNTPQWHVTVNEGVTVEDITDRNAGISAAVLRGFREEMGITRQEIRNRQSDLFLVVDSFEVGLSGIAYIKMNYDTFKLCYLGAKDACLETEQIKSIEYSKRAITKFLQGDAPKTEACKYCLSMLLSRMI